MKKLKRIHRFKQMLRLGDKHMIQVYKDALAEVDYILNLVSEDMLKKIPNSFLNFIKKQKTQNYQLTIKDKIPLTEQSLKRETKAIISLIYRSYLCSADESKRYKMDDKIELKKQQLKLDEKYKYENIFKKEHKR